jgi:hypothetical protein
VVPAGEINEAAKVVLKVPFYIDGARAGTCVARLYISSERLPGDPLGKLERPYFEDVYYRGAS